MYSVTFDRGGEFTFHDILKHAGVDTYFCDPGCPHQKGHVENRNGKMRYSMFSGFDFRLLTQAHLNHIVAGINSENIKNQNCSPSKAPQRDLGTIGESYAISLGSLCRSLMTLSPNRSRNP